MQTLNLVLSALFIIAFSFAILTLRAGSDPVIISSTNVKMAETVVPDFVASNNWFIQVNQGEWVKGGVTLYPFTDDRSAAVIAAQGAVRDSLDTIIQASLEGGYYKALNATVRGLTLEAVTEFNYIAATIKTDEPICIVSRANNKLYTLKLYPSPADRTAAIVTEFETLETNLSIIENAASAGGFYN